MTTATDLCTVTTEALQSELYVTMGNSEDRCVHGNYVYILFSTQIGFIDLEKKVMWNYVNTKTPSVIRNYLEDIKL